MRLFGKHNKSNIGEFNLRLFLTVLFLLAFGLIALYSASTVESYKNFGTTTRYILHQVIYGAGGGLVCLFFFYKFDYHNFKKFLPLLLGASVLLLLFVKFSAFSHNAGGAERWLRIGGNTFQPSELIKITIIVYLAAWIERKKDLLHDFYNGLLPSLLVVGVISFLILSQPDFGTMFAILAISAVMLFAGGVPLKYMFSGLLVLSVVLYLFIHFEPYRAQRLVAFLNPEIDPRGISYQVNQSILAIGAGGPLGYGYGMSRQKYNYLPASYTDSIFAVTSEELGIWGAGLILLGFVYFSLQGLKIAKVAPDVFGEMLAVGITTWIAIQALVNIGALTGLLPLTGIPLPFFSYGSTALIANLAAVGILLNISKQS